MADDTGNEYSPLLAQMLRINPEQIGSVSLSALGRQVVGADTEGYRKAKEQVDAARMAMEKALADRRGGPDPSMLALAQGFLAPTRTGSFGESVSSAIGGYSKAQLEEEKRFQDIARMRYDIARAGLADEAEMAKLGLSVVSKLTPKLTAFQQQVQSEGIDPRSPAGIERIKELQAEDKATGEMKEFSARTGTKLTDPQFATKFAPYNKPVQDALSSFGGNINNPKDLARAQQIVSENIRLEQESKRTSIEQSRVQIQRTRQEIDEHIRNQDFGAVQSKAAELGVPLADPNRYAGLNKIETAKKREEERKEADKMITEKVAPLVEGIDSDINDLERAKTLNNQIRTGWSYGLPVVGETAKRVSGDLAKIQEFDALASKASRANRIPGDHNISNFDVQMMQRGTFSSDKQPVANKIIIDYMLEQRKRDRDYNQFMSNYAAVNGALDSNAIAQWRKYVNANPITTRNEKGETVLNPNRVGYREYFTAPRVRVRANGQEVQ